MRFFLLLRAIFLSLAALSCWIGCSGGGTTTGNPAVAEDSSSSGTVAGSVGGALSGSSANGTLARMLMPQRAVPSRFLDFLNPISIAHASGLCPTFRSSSGCASNSESLWLTYQACNFPNSLAEWTGFQSITPSANTPPSCGTFPNPGPNNNLIRQFVTASGSTVPASAFITTGFGTLSAVDDHSSNLKNFNNDSVATLQNGGYGSKVGFGPNGGRNSVSVAHRLWTEGLFDFSVTGTLAVSEADGAASRTVNGSVTVYHNILQVIGTSTFNNVTHSDSCCLPISGSITTVFSAGSVAPTELGLLMVGKSETLTFTSCGEGLLQTYNGTQQTVALSRCY